MRELPIGWTWASLQDLVADAKSDIVDGPFGSNLKASEYQDSGVPIVRIQNVDRNRFVSKNIRFVTLEKAEELKRHSFKKGDIIVTKLGNPLAKACIVPGSLERGVIVADVVRARLHTLISTSYLCLALNSPAVVQAINCFVKGSTRPRVNLSHIRSMKVALAPRGEQTRIAMKLEYLLAKIEKCQQRLERIPIILKRFRQSVLAAACSGKLTEDWRANDGISELPEGWCWKRLADLLPPKGGLFDGPFGSNLKTDDYTNAGVRVVRLENVGSLRFFDDKRTYISKNKYESLRKHAVREGDIIFSSFISNEMRVCMLPRLGELAIAKADCFCIRPLSEVISPDYLLLQLACDTTLTALMASVHGATRPRVNISQLKELTIRMCPRDEQETIVSRATQLFELADQIEVRFQKAKAEIDKLTPSILAKAFRGELVPQDPNDEPAEKLLERIRAARAQAVPPRPSKQRGSGGKTARAKASR